MEFEAQPEPRIEYTVRLERAKINNTPRFMFEKGKGIESGVQMIIASEKANAGDKRKSI